MTLSRDHNESEPNFAVFDNRKNVLLALALLAVLLTAAFNLETARTATNERLASLAIVLFPLFVNLTVLPIVFVGASLIRKRLGVQGGIGTKVDSLETAVSSLQSEASSLSKAVIDVREKMPTTWYFSLADMPWSDYFGSGVELDCVCRRLNGPLDQCLNSQQLRQFFDSGGSLNFVMPLPDQTDLLEEAALERGIDVVTARNEVITTLRVLLNAQKGTPGSLNVYRPRTLPNYFLLTDRSRFLVSSPYEQYIPDSEIGARFPFKEVDIGGMPRYAEAWNRERSRLMDPSVTLFKLMKLTGA